METIKVTVNSHYSFAMKWYVGTDPEDFLGLQITQLPNNDYQVVGPYDDVKAFAQEICIDNHTAVRKIMNTAVTV